METNRRPLTAENDIRKALGHYQKKVTLNDGSVRENMSMIPSACFSVECRCKWSLYTVRRRLRPWNRLLASNGARQAWQRQEASYKDIIGYYYKDVYSGGYKHVYVVSSDMSQLL